MHDLARICLCASEVRIANPISQWVLLPPPPLALEELAEPHWEAVEGQQAAVPHQPPAASSEPVAGRWWEAVVVAELVVPRVHGWHLGPGAAWRVVAQWAHCQHLLAPCHALGVVEAPVAVELGSVVAASVPAVRAGVQQELRQPLQRGLAQRAMSPGKLAGAGVAGTGTRAEIMSEPCSKHVI